ncbi:MAG: hypothetical protein HYR60_18810 [Acidobacteria bacterium]|nr:hypothetical protein [Acidobacteriota bacterium]
MSESIRGLLAEGVLAVTKDWAAIKKKEDRDRRQAESTRERYWRGYSFRVTAKAAAYEVMSEAYEKASGSGRYPANARQIMYAARPAIQERTEQTLSDVYFTQVLLPDYIREHADETAGWDVVYDARGHLWEPHTGEQIGVGTLEVRKYLRDIEGPLELGIESPRLNGTFPTSGPRNRYNAVLYIEKEGFMPLLERARFAEQYDFAIMSSKGMGTVASRRLIENLSETVTIFVLHDFDKSGFSIAGTLTRDTRRYEFTRDPDVVDLGLRLADVEEWGLQSESVQYKSDPTCNLEENGATVEEIAFLHRGSRHGKRVELNAFTSDQFVAWLDSKLVEHGVEKVIPDDGILEQAYRRAAAIRRYQKIIDEAGEEIATYAKGLTVPKTLRATVAKRLAKDPTLAWDEVLAVLAGEQERSL